MKKWSPADFENVRSILRDTWLATYTALIPREDILEYLDKTYSTDKLNDLYSKDGCSGLLLFVNEKAAAFMRTQISATENRFYISSLYVLPEFQGYGLGNELLQEAVKEAKLNGFKKIHLGVMSGNIKSVEWYRKRGFIFETEEPFTMVNTTVLHLIGYLEV